MNFIKHNIGTIIAIMLLIVVVVLLYEAKVTFFPDDGKAIYGERLSQNKEYKISNDQLKSAENSIKDSCEEVKVRLQGKIIQANIVISNDMSGGDAKGLADKIASSFSDSQKTYYDIQVFIKKENDTTSFPIVGYKHHTSDHFSWTKDR